jgi:GT2 family glycosyltransferase
VGAAGLRTVILVPRRDDNGWRDELWAFCRAWWVEHHDPMPIYEGHHLAEEGPFNRSMALNRASALADRDVRWDLALIIDSDTISDPNAVRASLRHATKTGTLGIAHDHRYMMNEVGTRKILGGDRGSWTHKRGVQIIYKDSISCAVAVRRDAWDLVGGFDERFVGWGFEDTAFRIAVETLTGIKLKTERADCFHLWHPLQPSATKRSPTYTANHILKRRYDMAYMHADQLRLVLDHTQEAEMTIPMILHRTVPEVTTREVERWWKHFQALHPAWDHRTYREPIDPADWPLTGDLFDRCQNGAQKAGLIRLEALFTHGGIYVDSDVEPIRRLDPLLNLQAFAAWEDEKVVPDAVLGSVPQHPAFKELLTRARASIERGEDAWHSGPGATTAVLPDRDDVLLLPPGSFYPAHYLEKAKLGTNGAKPWVFLEHKWHHSWGSKEQHESNVRRQRAAPTTDIKFALCMPWRDSGDDWRRRAHDWCVRYWADAGFTVFEGGGQSRSEMCNNAAAQAIEWGAGVLVIVDADTWTPIEQIVKAVEMASSTGHLAHAFTTYAQLGSAKTQQLQRRRGVTAAMAVRGVQLRHNHVSGACAITTDLWQQVGGFDERFVGWGFEDQAFNLAAECIGGGIERINGNAIHWYHRSDPTKSRSLDPSDSRIPLMERYCQAAGRVPDGGRVLRLATAGLITVDSEAPTGPEAMRALLADDGGPLSRKSLTDIVR